MNSSINHSDRPQIKKQRSKLDASSPNQLQRSNGKPPSFHPPQNDETLKTIEIIDDLGSIDVNATDLSANNRRRGATATK